MLSHRDGYSEYQRSITLDHLSYDARGFIEAVSTSPGQVAQLRDLDAFSRLEAETLADQQGIETGPVEEDGEQVGVAVTDIHDEDWIGYSQVVFGDGATRFRARVAAAADAGGSIGIYLDGCDRFSNLPGERVGTCAVDPSGGWQHWTEVECAIEPLAGVHDLYLSFSGSGVGPLFNLDYFQFE